jgi:hypothetical protein
MSSSNLDSSSIPPLMILIFSRWALQAGATSYAFALLCGIKAGTFSTAYKYVAVWFGRKEPWTLGRLQQDEQ